MKRTLIILILSIALTVGACCLGIVTAAQAEQLTSYAQDFEQACKEENAEAAADAVRSAGEYWQQNELLFSSLCRLETCLGIERCLQEMEQALNARVFEDGITTCRELQRLCGEAGHLGLPEWSDVL